MILVLVVPIERAASTNSRSLMASTSPRTIRAVGIQEVIATTVTIRMNMPPSGPKLALSGCRNSVTATSSSGRIGSDRNRSVRRISGPSSLLKKPASTPTPAPMIRLSAMAAQPTAMEACPPARSWASVSRPSWSEPSGLFHPTFMSSTTVSVMQADRYQGFGLLTSSTGTSSDRARPRRSSSNGRFSDSR